MRPPIFRRWNSALGFILLLVIALAQTAARADDSNTAVEDALKLAASRQAPVIVELDANSPTGARWMQQWTIKGLPS
ncbi:MAG: hypothetical protein Q8M37_11805 [Nevskia sp.]|nr:hypothetical protein [Nevskia sp.]